MTLSSRFFADGSYYGQSDLAKLVADALPYGYVSGVGSELKVTAPGGSMTIQVETGRGYINGYMFDVEDAAYQLVVPTADPTNPRIDRVVARVSVNTGMTVTLVIKQGSASSSPVAPDITRSGDIWEISLAQVRVPKATSVIVQSNITDERSNYTVCGIANKQLVSADRLTGTISADRLPTIPESKLPSVSPSKLPVATTSTIGAIKVGDGLNVTSDGTLSCVRAWDFDIVYELPDDYISPYWVWEHEILDTSSETEVTVSGEWLGPTVSCDWSCNHRREDSGGHLLKITEDGTTIVSESGVRSKSGTFTLTHGKTYSFTGKGTPSGYAVTVTVGPGPCYLILR